MSNGAYGHRFAARRKSKGRWRFDEGFADTLIELFDGGSVLDLGAGIGNYVKHFRENGIDATGYDGIEGIWELSDETIMQADLTMPLLGEAPHDWVICLETGEHITPEKTDVLLANIHQHNDKGAVISWGQPGQRGKGHINCRPKTEIEQHFIDMGYRLDREAEAKLQAVTFYGCFKKNLFVARR